MDEKEIKRLCRIYEQCRDISAFFKEGYTPQDIAVFFNAKKHWYNDDDPEYVYYNIDFEDFGITFVAFKDNPDNWWWQNGDEIWDFDIEDWRYWHSLI